MNSRQSIIALVESLGPQTTLLPHVICSSGNHTAYAFLELILTPQIPTYTKIHRRPTEIHDRVSSPSPISQVAQYSLNSQPAQLAIPYASLQQGFLVFSSPLRYALQYGTTVLGLEMSQLF